MKYKLIKQEPFCCVPRCLQMIFERNNISFDSQIQMAKELGFKNDGKYKGTQIQNGEYSIDNYLTKHRVPLSFEYIYDLNYNDVKKDISCQRYLHSSRFSIADHQCNHASF